MNRHRFDPVPALLGALFIALGLTYVVADVRDLQVYESVVATAAVVGVALLAFVSSVRAVVRRARTDVPPVPGADPGTGGTVSQAAADADRLQQSADGQDVAPLLRKTDL